MFLLLSGIALHGQSDTTNVGGEIVSSEWKDRGLTVGIDFGQYFYGEIGHFRNYVYEVGGFPMSSQMMNYGCEFSYYDKLIVAPKVQGRVHLYFFNASAAALLYTDISDNYSFKIRPEIGVGLWNFDINYGYNIGVVNNDFRNINKHNIGLRYYWKLKRKHLHEFDREGNKVR